MRNTCETCLVRWMAPWFESSGLYRYRNRKRIFTLRYRWWSRSSRCWTTSIQGWLNCTREQFRYGYSRSERFSSSVRKSSEQNTGNEFDVFRKANPVAGGAATAAAGTTTSANTTSGNDGDNPNRITYDEFAILVRRIDRMEYSIGNIVSRVKISNRARLTKVTFSKLFRLMVS